MKIIPLTMGYESIIDDEDFDSLSKYSWRISFSSGENKYAVRSFLDDSGKYIVVPMHRSIMGLVGVDRKTVVDHINHNGLDNRRSNLRVCTQRENTFNQRARPGGSSVFKGVCFDGSINSRYKKKWRSFININGKRKNIGRFLTEKEAALAYDECADRIHGEFAVFNFRK